MNTALKTLPILLALALGAPAFAQATGESPATGTEESPGEGPDPMELSMGEDVKLGDIYIESEHGDWELRCIKSEAERDPCQLYQLLDDGNGNPVAEINVFPIAGDEKAAAGATVITPLETLLTQQLAMSVDGAAAKKYPFSWCSQIGCFSRIGFTKDDVAAFKRGNKATLTIVPVAAADQKVNLTVSLAGFTAGFDALAARIAQ